jgi:hypothetical protein
MGPVSTMGRVLGQEVLHQYNSFPQEYAGPTPNAAMMTRLDRAKPTSRPV